MTWCRLFLAVVLPAALVAPTQAGIFFKKKQPNPAQRVPELIVILKTDTSDRKRAAAAQELRNYDAVQFPEIVPTLTDAALSDPKPGVRIDAVESLARIRPVSQQAGMAIEQVLAHDSNLRVRLEARTSLWQYHLHGYHGQPAPAATTTVAMPGTISTTEPPLASGPQGPVNSEPPLAPVVSQTIVPSLVPLKPIPPGSPARRMPRGPTQAPITPMEPPQLDTPPTTGPDLNLPPA